MDGTLPGQQVLTSTLEHIAADAARQRVRPPAVVVIGDVVGLRDKLSAATQGAERHRERGVA
jgi:siroheme synthase